MIRAPLAAASGDPTADGATFLSVVLASSGTPRSRGWSAAISTPAPRARAAPAPAAGTCTSASSSTPACTPPSTAPRAPRHDPTCQAAHATIAVVAIRALGARRSRARRAAVRRRPAPGRLGPDQPGDGGRADPAGPPRPRPATAGAAPRWHRPARLPVGRRARRARADVPPDVDPGGPRPLRARPPAGSSRCTTSCVAAVAADRRGRGPTAPAPISIEARRVEQFAAGERQLVGTVKNAIVDALAARGVSASPSIPSQPDRPAGRAPG
jgi:hypothetical protein